MLLFALQNFAVNLNGAHFSFQGRHTKLAIVLLQKSTNSADDAVSGERLSTLAAKCDITQKMISILPYNDNLMGNDSLLMNIERKIPFIIKHIYFNSTIYLKVILYAWSQHS